jgi:methylated-DNA-[protein]-cysteine S-methyltransferase
MEAAVATLMATDWGPLYLAATAQGLCLVAFRTEPTPTELRHLKRYGVAAPEPGSTPVLAESVRQLGEYFAGQRRAFELPLDLRGTPFQRAVWDALLRIPFGESRSYSGLAQELGRPRAARAVGQAVGANPVSIIVPCHRVLGQNGSLTGYGGGLERKVALLWLEGLGRGT